jgi:hypothetical protein
MRSRLVIFVSVVIAAAAVAFAVNRFASAADPPGELGSPSTNPGSYLGVFEAGALDAYRPIADFTKAVGKQPNLVGYYSGWGEPFETSFAQRTNKHGAATIVQWNPTFASVSKIVAGGYDTYLRSFADSVREFGHPVIIGFGHEMNADWYSWGYGHLPPATFVAAWRHIVTLFRTQHADSVTWLWTLQADEPGTGPIKSWWPGAKYVTWVGIDGYYYHSYENFSSIFGKTIAQVRTFTSLPVLLSEVAVGPQAGQARKIPDLFAGMRQYGTLGLVWFDIAQHQGVYHQNWHVEDNPAAIQAFRRAAAALPLTHP